MSFRDFEAISTVDCLVGLAAVVTVALLYKVLQSRLSSKNIPLPPGPSAGWFWENPLPSEK